MKSLVSHKSIWLNQKSFLQTVRPAPLVYTEETEGIGLIPNHTGTGQTWDYPGALEVCGMGYTWKCKGKEE